MAAATLAQRIQAYITAKDTNRPHLVASAFAPTATVKMILHTDTIAFSPRAEGVDAIADMLVRRFGRQYDNVYTYCLCNAPPPAALRLDCGWLVVMTEKETRQVRLGFGRYAWEASSDEERLVQRLSITIERMEVLAESIAHAAFGWAGSLPYPWCPPESLAGPPPALEELVREAALAGS